MNNKNTEKNSIKTTSIQSNSNSVKNNCKTQLRNEHPEISKQETERRDGPGGQ